MAIISTSDYNTYAGISGQDTVVGVLIAGAQKAIENYCNVASFDEATYTDEKYDGTGTDTLILRNIPVTAVSAVKVREGLADADTTTLETNTYLYDTRSALLRRLSFDEGWGEWDRGFSINHAVRIKSEPCWPMGYMNVLVTYTAGYTTFPADLKHAMYRLVDSLRGRRGRDGSLQSESMGAYSWTAAQAEVGAVAFITGEVASMLAPYRRGGL